MPEARETFALSVLIPSSKSTMISSGEIRRTDVTAGGTAARTWT